MVFVTGIESFLPGRRVTNDEMEELLGLVNGEVSRAKKIVLRSNGIKGRHYAIDPDTKKPTHTNSQISAEAIQKLMKANSLSASEIELLCCGTTSPDQLLPSHASMVHGELKGKPHEIVSTAGVCCSAISALKYGYLSLLSGDKNRAVVTGSEISSKFMKGPNFVKENIESLKKSEVFQFEQDFLRWMLSDGAGAFLLEREPRAGQMNFQIEWIDFKSYANELPACMYGGALKKNDGGLTSWLDYDRKDLIEDRVLNISQDTKLLDEHITEYCVSKTLGEIKKRRGLHPGDIDWFVPHYSSGFFRQKVFDHLKKIDFEIPFEKWFTSIEESGNIGSASFFIYMHDLLKTGKVKDGDHILGFIPESSRFSSAYVYLKAVQG